MQLCEIMLYTLQYVKTYKNPAKIWSFVHKSEFHSDKSRENHQL